jgi:predicted Zn-dependent protease
VLDLQNRNPDSDAVAAYEDAVTKQMQPNIDDAHKNLQEVIDLSKKNSVANKWSQQALEDMNKEDPVNFPVLHQELFQGTEAP